MIRDSMSPMLAAAPAHVVYGCFRAPAHVVQRRAPLGTLLSQRWCAHASLQHRVYLVNERLQLISLTSSPPNAGIC